jgi:translin
MTIDRAEELLAARAVIVEKMSGAHEAREKGLAACRQVIRACSKSIRMTHRQEFDAARATADEAEAFLRTAQEAMAPYPKVAYAGFQHDAEKEYAEARLTAAFVEGAPLPTAAELRVDGAAWLNGLA